MIAISSRKVLIVLVGCSLLVIGAGWLVEILHLMPNGPSIPAFIRRRVSMMNEANVPAWYTSLLLFLASLLLYAGYRESRASGSTLSTRWAALATIFLFLSMDEAVAWHETTGTLMRKLGLPGGHVQFQWIFAAVPFVGILAIWFLPWVLRQERRTRTLFFASAALFLTGALAMEPISSGLASSRGDTSVAFYAGRALSDLFEMLGVSVFIYGLLEYLRSRAGKISIELK